MRSISFGSAQKYVMPVQRSVKNIVTWNTAKNALRLAGPAQKPVRPVLQFDK
jgi:hypothetical protein